MLRCMKMGTRNDTSRNLMVRMVVETSTSTQMLTSLGWENNNRLEFPFTLYV